MNPNYVASNFKINVKLGTDGDGNEQGILGSINAIAKNEEASTPNYDFIRDDSLLVLVILSDEDEDCNGTRLTERIESLATIKAEHMQKLAIYTIIHKVEVCSNWPDIPSNWPDIPMIPKYSSHEECLDDYKEDYNVEEVGEKYMEAVSLLGGDSFEITLGFGAALTDLGNNIVNLLNSFILSSVPDPSTIKVLVNGIPVTSGWHFEAKSNSVVFDDEPPEGVLIKIGYEAYDPTY